MEGACGTEGDRERLSLRRCDSRDEGNAGLESGRSLVQVENMDPAAWLLFAGCILVLLALSSTLI